MTSWVIDPNTPLDELWARYICETASERDPETNKLHLTTYGGTHIGPYFKTLGGITTARVKDYVRARLAVVKKETVAKELSALRCFLAWCEEQGYVDSAPLIAKLGSRLTGKPHPQRRRGKATDLSVEEARAIVNLLPNYSKSKRVPQFVVRERFVFMYETALRPGTINTLSVPEHYTPGSTTLTITDENDKARFGRELPLSEEARAALDAVCPDSGLIFGDHDYRDQLRKAAEERSASGHVHGLRPAPPAADQAGRGRQHHRRGVPCRAQAALDHGPLPAPKPARRGARAPRCRPNRLQPSGP